jgi:hypothetical protein
MSTTGRRGFRHNPAEGLRLTLPEMERERQLMAPDLFAAERMGWWGNPGSSTGW